MAVLKLSRINSLEFDKKLQSETRLLEKWFKEKYFLETPFKAGAEIEFFLLDKQYHPAPHNLEFIDLVSEKFLIPEVGRSQLEINSNHFTLTKDCLSKFHQNILKFWDICRKKAWSNNYHLALIGSLPTANFKCHSLKYLTPNKRFAVINAIMRKYNLGKPISIRLKGFEPLNIFPQSAAVNGLISAFQIHIQVGVSSSVRFYNSAQIISGPLLSLACNSPFIFGHFIWNESRIFIFNEVMTLSRFNNQNPLECCFFGKKYLDSSIFELFKENLDVYPRLIPEISDSLPEEMVHVRLQNGVVYRWNRPVIGFNKNNIRPHLRIEHRCLPAGPTIVDQIAHAAFFYGMLVYLSTQTVPPETLLPFQFAKQNFYNAAKYGLEARMKWLNGKNIKAIDLLKTLIPQAEEGLNRLGIAPNDSRFYLGILRKRLQRNINGSCWQRAFVAKYGKDFYSMLNVYLMNQNTELPISDWEL